MKKLFALLFVAAAFTFTSCGDASGNATPDAETEETTGTEDAPKEEAPAEETPAETPAEETPATEEITEEVE